MHLTEKQGSLVIGFLGSALLLAISAAAWLAWAHIENLQSQIDKLQTDNGNHYTTLDVRAQETDNKVTGLQTDMEWVKDALKRLLDR